IPTADETPRITKTHKPLPTRAQTPPRPPAPTQQEPAPPRPPAQPPAPTQQEPQQQQQPTRVVLPPPLAGYAASTGSLRLPEPGAPRVDGEQLTGRVGPAESLVAIERAGARHRAPQATL